MTRTEYTIVATDRSVDARAAADACNRELMALAKPSTGGRPKTRSLSAQNACDALRVEAEEIEIEGRNEDNPHRHPARDDLR